MRYLLEKKESGYTINEVIIVIIVLSILLSLAVPNYAVFMERMRAQEMVPILYALYDAQKQRLLDQGAYGKGDWNHFIFGVSRYIGLPDWSANFNEPDLECGAAGPCSGGGAILLACSTGNFGQIALVSRTGWGYQGNANYQYRLIILEDGQIACWDEQTNTCEGVCLKLGFPPPTPIL